MSLFGRESFRDPVCGMAVTPRSAAAKEIHNGTTYYFCSESCRDEFLKEPKRFTG